MFLDEEFGHTVIQNKSSVQLPSPKGLKKFTISHSPKSSNNYSQLKARHLEAFSYSVWHNILKYCVCLFLLSAC